jgi:hypothetical protein
MKKPKVVATVERTTQAIDYTPIHYFRICRPIRSGSVVRWDEAEKVLYLDDESFSSRDDIED